MRLYRQCFGILTMLIACSCGGTAQSVIPFTVTHGGDTTIVTFGIADEATYCNDSLSGEVELPPRPPLGIFDVRFVDHRDTPCLGLGLRLQLQSPWQTDTFRLSLQKGEPLGENTWTFSWPTISGAEWQIMTLTDTLGFGIFTVDMTATTSATITQSFISAVDIIATHVVLGVDPEHD